MMDTSGLPFAKPRPGALEREDRRQKRAARDEAENTKIRARSHRQCEAVVIGEGRCVRRACHPHHMIGGWGKRARGISVLAEHKQHLCPQCHEDIGAHILQRVGGPVPLWTDKYRRMK